MPGSRIVSPSLPIALAIALMLAICANLASAETADDGRLRQLAGQAASYAGDVRALLAKGADPNVPDRAGRTAVHGAAAISAAETMQALLDAGGNPNRRDKDGNTPLHLASVAARLIGAVATIRLLLRAEADPGIANGEGRTALHLVAAHYEQPEAVEALLAHGADANRRDRWGSTPLHAALGHNPGWPGWAGAGLPGIVRALLAGGADPCIRDAQGFIPYSIATEGGPIHRALDRARGHDLACNNQEAVSLDSSEQRRIQEALAGAGFDPGPADGKFGPRTQRAIQGWQQAKGYAATGELTRDQAETLLTETPPAVALQPKCAELPGQYLGDNDAECWDAIENRSGCHWWNGHYHSDRATTQWSGRCRGGIADGRGTLFISDGSEHSSYEGTGTLSRGKKNGHWTEVWTDGDRYEGGFRDGIEHGRGTLTWADGGRYEGGWRDGKPHGHGTLTEVNGKRYEGEWREGCFGERDGKWWAVFTTAAECGFK